MNEDVLDMIDTLHARLDDVRDAVKALEGEAPGYAKRLDRLDDSLYLIQRELEMMPRSSGKANGQADEPKRATDADAVAEGAADPEAPKAADDDVEAVAKAGEGDSSKKGGEIFSDDMKENLADAGRALGNIYRDGKEVVSELSGTVGELKDVFSFGSKKRR